MTRVDEALESVLEGYASFLREQLNDSRLDHPINAWGNEESFYGTTCTLCNASQTFF